MIIKTYPTTKRGVTFWDCCDAQSDAKITTGRAWRAGALLLCAVDGSGATFSGSDFDEIAAQIFRYSKPIQRRRRIEPVQLCPGIYTTFANYDEIKINYSFFGVNLSKTSINYSFS